MLTQILTYVQLLQVKCNSCHETHPKYVSLNRKVWHLFELLSNLKLYT